MYILQQNNQVIYGPAEYSVSMFKYILIEDCELQPEDFTIPTKIDGAYDVTSTISILPATIVYPNLNGKIEQLSGPTWEITKESATGTYGVAPKNLDAVKNELKTQVAANRYTLETADLKLTVAGVDVIVEGSRENKTIFMLSYGVLPEEGVTNWKFPKSGNFVACSKADIGQIITAFVTQTQGAFDLEAAKVAEIDACLTLEELDAISVKLGE